MFARIFCYIICNRNYPVGGAWGLRSPPIILKSYIARILLGRGCRKVSMCSPCSRQAPTTVPQILPTNAPTRFSAKFRASSARNTCSQLERSTLAARTDSGWLAMIAAGSQRARCGPVQRPPAGRLLLRLLTIGASSPSSVYFSWRPLPPYG